jgi:HEAT repeat protein
MHMDARAETARRCVEQLGSGHYERRQHAYQALLAMGENAADALLVGARDADWRVRASCLGLIDHRGDERCFAVLRDAVRDESLHVRRRAAHALACRACKIQPLDGEVIGLLLRLATADPSIQVRRVAVTSLLLQPRSRRVARALRRLLRVEQDEKLLRRAWLALRHHDADPRRAAGGRGSIE